jgi:hypothetical protein
MRLYEFTGKTIEEMLAEIDRRGFLKGLGAAAATAAIPSMAKAAPFSHSKNVDPMTNKERGKSSAVKSDNSDAVLTIQWPGHEAPGVWISIPKNNTMDFTNDIIMSSRIKINGNISNLKLWQLSGGNYNQAKLDISPNTVLKASGDLWIEIPMFRGERKIFKFTLEQDKETKKFKQDDDEQDAIDAKQLEKQKQMRQDQESSRLQKEKDNQEEILKKEKESREIEKQQQEKQQQDKENKENIKDLKTIISKNIVNRLEIIIPKAKQKINDAHYFHRSYMQDYEATVRFDINKMGAISNFAIVKASQSGNASISNILSDKQLYKFSAMPEELFNKVSKEQEVIHLEITYNRPRIGSEDAPVPIISLK